MESLDKPSSRFFQLPGLKRDPTKHQEQPAEERRLAVLNILPNSVRNHFVAGASEFVGTFMFLFLAFSATQVANAAAAGATVANGASGKISQVPNVGVLLYISLSFGFSLAVNAWVFFRISGGLFNPAVTLGLALIGGVTWIRAGVAVLAQMLGAMASAAVVLVLFPGPLAVTTTLNDSTSVARGLFIEMFLTAQLVFTIFMLAAEKHKATFIAPVGIGLALFVCEMSGVYFTGGSLNPARSFGPCVALKSFPSYHWIYWLGPALGSLVAVTFYRLIKSLEYETANPNQDAAHEEEVVEDEEKRDSIQPRRSTNSFGSGPRSRKWKSASSPAIHEGVGRDMPDSSAHRFTNGPLMEGREDSVEEYR